MDGGRVVWGRTKAKMVAVELLIHIYTLAIVRCPRETDPSGGCLFGKTCRRVENDELGNWMRARAKVIRLWAPQKHKYSQQFRCYLFPLLQILLQKEL